MESNNENKLVADLEKQIIQETEKGLKDISENERKKAIRQKQNANLKPVDIRIINAAKSRQEVLENCSKGGKRSGEVRRQKRNLQQIAQWLLEKDLPDGMIADSLGDTAVLRDENGVIDKSGGAVLLARMIQEAMAGNTKAMELVRDTSGQKPTDKVQVEAITDADRSLMAKIESRLSNKSTD